MEIIDIRFGQGCKECEHAGECPNAFTEVSHSCGAYSTKTSGYYQPIRFAKWIKRDKWLYCSACGDGGWGLGAVTYEWKYCPLCGAKIGE